jgi:hypothetical protein
LLFVSVTVTVGVMVSTVKLPVLPPSPKLPLFSDQLPAFTLTARRHRGDRRGPQRPRDGRRCGGEMISTGIPITVNLNNSTGGDGITIIDPGTGTGTDTEGLPGSRGLPRTSPHRAARGGCHGKWMFGRRLEGLHQSDI